jgi:two-component system sensor histidine kinase DesK
MLSRFTARDRLASGELSLGLLWGMYLIWLPFMIPSVVVLLRSHAAPARTVLTLLGAALFTGLYVWSSRDNARDLLRPLPAAARPWWRTWLPIAALVALSLLYVIAAGPAWGSLFIFTSAIVAGRLPPLQGLLIVVALMFVVAIGGALSYTDWSLLGQGLALMFFVGVTVITSMRAIAGTIRANRALRAAPERAEAEIGYVETAARTALHEVREAVAGYRQPTLESELHAATEILTAAGIACDATGELPALPAGVEAALSWTLREGVTNVIRHSRARHCAITMRRDVGSVAVQISDDGRASPLARVLFRPFRRGLCGGQRATWAGGAHARPRRYAGGWSGAKRWVPPGGLASCRCGCRSRRGDADLSSSGWIK